MRDHIASILKSLYRLPIKACIEYNLLVHVYKVLNGNGPEYLRDLLKLYKPNRSLHSVSPYVIIIKEPRTKLMIAGDTCFHSAGPKLWNRLPTEI